MIAVEEALARVLDLVAPVSAETVGLRSAAGRVLAEPVAAARPQPPFAASAMDGYAVRSADARPGARLKVIAEAAAGHGVAAGIGPGEAVRIFTGAPVPEGADRVIAQEDTHAEADMVVLTGEPGGNTYVRPAGSDFAAGTRMEAPRPLAHADLALLAAMNVAELSVMRRPVVALIATGDELVMPGGAPAADQITASNVFALASMVEAEGAEARLLPIARDTPRSLETVFAVAAGAELIVTVGGASVGEHDLVGEVAAGLGMKRAFYKVAMRPGKPLMAGRLGPAAMIGLPGNPVSAIVCGHVFLVPALRKMLGLGAGPAPTRSAPLVAALGPNGPRAHYMRARLRPEGLEPFERQDSSLLSVLVAADALAIRPAHDAARAAGERMDYLPLSRPSPADGGVHGSSPAAPSDGE